MTFQYVTRTPPALARFVESIWFAEGQIPYPRERIAPTGATVAVIVLGDPIRIGPDGPDAAPTLIADDGFVIGPHDAPVVNEPTGRTHAIGVVTTPVGCRAVLGIEPSDLRGRVVELAEGWPAGPALRTRLTSSRDPSPDALLDLVVDAVAAGHDPTSGPALDLAEAAVAAITADTSLAIGDVATSLGVSHGHLDRAFKEVVGISPATLRRILRLRRVLDAAEVDDPPNWSHVAAEEGWFDQSHFTRDFRRHTGVAPSAYVAAQRTHLESSDRLPGFVPEG